MNQLFISTRNGVALIVYIVASVEIKRAYLRAGARWTCNIVPNGATLSIDLSIELDNYSCPIAGMEIDGVNQGGLSVDDICNNLGTVFTNGGAASSNINAQSFWADNPDTADFGLGVGYLPPYGNIILGYMGAPAANRPTFVDYIFNALQNNTAVVTDARQKGAYTPGENYVLKHTGGTNIIEVERGNIVNWATEIRMNEGDSIRLTWCDGYINAPGDPSGTAIIAVRLPS